MQIFYSRKFAKEYKRLPLKVKLLAEKKEEIFRKNPFESQLKTHKLGGRLRDYNSFPIDFQYRIVFEFENKDTVWFHSVGDHSIYG